MHKIHSIERIERFRDLSARETQLIVLASEGLTDKEIARFLGISNGTVVTMWSRMRAKLGISSRVSAVAVVVSSVSRIWGRAFEGRQDYQFEDGYRILMSEKHIALSCDDMAVNVLGVKPGESVPNKLATVLMDADDQLIAPSQLQPCKPARTVFDQSGTGYTLNCSDASDPVLGRAVMLEIVPLAAREPALQVS